MACVPALSSHEASAAVPNAIYSGTLLAIQTGMNVLRIIKSLLVASVALFASLVAVNNLVDYGSNFQFVRHVLSMDTTFPDNQLMYRAITSEPIHHVAYGLIIAMEALTGLLCAIGAVHMFSNRNAGMTQFRAARLLASLGLTCGIVLWSTGFLAIGAEWFLMWQSAQWNGQEAAFRFAMVLFATLIFIHQAETDSVDSQVLP